MLQEWRFPNRATPEGSSAYYSVRFASSAVRDDLAVLHGWRHQVRAILDEVSDPGIARLKLQWWREELGRTFAGEPRHPLCQALQPAVERHRLPQDSFLDMAARVESEILHRHPADEAALDAACQQDLGALFELVGRCHALNDGAQLRTARELGGFCARVYLIRDSGALARQGRDVLPLELLHAHGLSTEALAQREHRHRLPELLAPAATRARSTLPASAAKHGMPGCIRARTAILESLLQELERNGFDVADQRIGLTPLRKLWLAWKESRRR